MRLPSPDQNFKNYPRAIEGLSQFACTILTTYCLVIFFIRIFSLFSSYDIKKLYFIILYPSYGYVIHVDCNSYLYSLWLYYIAATGSFLYSALWLATRRLEDFPRRFGRLLNKVHIAKVKYSMKKTSEWTKIYYST